MTTPDKKILQATQWKDIETIMKQSQYIYAILYITSSDHLELSKFNNMATIFAERPYVFVIVDQTSVDARELVSEYDVHTVPTFLVVDVEGNEVKRVIDNHFQAVQSIIENLPSTPSITTTTTTPIQQFKFDYNTSLIGFNPSDTPYNSTIHGKLNPATGFIEGERELVSKDSKETLLETGKFSPTTGVMIEGKRIVTINEGYQQKSLQEEGKFHHETRCILEGKIIRPEKQTEQGLFDGRSLHNAYNLLKGKKQDVKLGAIQEGFFDLKSGFLRYGMMGMKKYNYRAIGEFDTNEQLIIGKKTLEDETNIGIFKDKELVKGKRVDKNGMVKVGNPDSKFFSKIEHLISQPQPPLRYPCDLIIYVEVQPTGQIFQFEVPSYLLVVYFERWAMFLSGETTGRPIPLDMSSGARPYQLYFQKNKLDPMDCISDIGISNYDKIYLIPPKPIQKQDHKRKKKIVPDFWIDILSDIIYMIIQGSPFVSLSMLGDIIFKLFSPFDSVSMLDDKSSDDIKKKVFGQANVQFERLKECILQILKKREKDKKVPLQQLRLWNDSYLINDSILFIDKETDKYHRVQYAVGQVPYCKLKFYSFPYEERELSTDDKFWPDLDVSLKHIISIQGIMTMPGYKLQEYMTINYINGKIKGFVNDNVVQGQITKHLWNLEVVRGPVINKVLEGRIIMSHFPGNFEEFDIKPSQTIITYENGFPLLNEEVVIFYDNDDMESGIFSAKLTTTKPRRRVLIKGTKKLGNLICTGKFDFKTGVLHDGEAVYKGPRRAITRGGGRSILSLENIRSGDLFPYDIICSGRWNPKTGVLTNGTITHNGSIKNVSNGIIESVVTMSSYKLDGDETRRKAIQQINKVRRNALFIGQEKSKYKTALLTKYRNADIRRKQYISDPIRASLQTLFNQSKNPNRRQFIRRIYQDEIHQKQLLEILLRLIKIYGDDRSNIVRRIRDNLSDLQPKTLRRGNVLPYIIGTLFAEPELKQMVLIYVSQKEETLIDLIQTMFPEQLFLGDELGKIIKNKVGQWTIPLTDLVNKLVSTIIAGIASRLPMDILGSATPTPPQLTPPPPPEEEEMEEDAMIYFVQQQTKPRQSQQQEQKQPLPVQACSWNISWIDIRGSQLLNSSIALLERIAHSSDFILLQETPFDPHEYTIFDQQLQQSVFFTLEYFHRAVVQPYLNIPGLKSQLHGMMIMVNCQYWDVVQRKRPQTHLLEPTLSDQSKSVRTPEGAIVSSVPPLLFCSEPEILAEQDLNRKAVWYSEDPMKDDHHEPHLFAKLSTLSGLFRNKQDPSFYMIVMNIHVRREGYNPKYRDRLLRDINKQIQLYIDYLGKIKGSTFSIMIGGDFNRSDHYIVTHLLNYIPALKDGHVIMNPFPIRKPAIDAFIIPDHVPFQVEFIEDVWQETQLQLKETGGGIKSIFPHGGHTPFVIMLNIPGKSPTKKQTPK